MRYLSVFTTISAGWRVSEFSRRFQHSHRGKPLCYSLTFIVPSAVNDGDDSGNARSGDTAEWRTARGIGEKSAGRMRERDGKGMQMGSFGNSDLAATHRLRIGHVRSLINSVFRIQSRRDCLAAVISFFCSCYAYRKCMSYACVFIRGICEHADRACCSRAFVMETFVTEFSALLLSLSLVITYIYICSYFTFRLSACTVRKLRRERSENIRSDSFE